MAAKPETTTVSTKGQVVLPKAVRDALRLRPGSRLIVEQKEDGVFLRAQPVATATKVEDVAGMLAWGGPPASVKDMDDAIAEHIRDQHARDRH